MFATLLGSLPRPPLDADTPFEEVLEAVVRAQETAGIDPITDGGLGGDLAPLEAWRAAARLTDRAVKQAITGPYTFGRSATDGDADQASRARRTLARAEALNATLRDLAGAGCPLIEVHDSAATEIGTDETERALFRDAHARLLDGVDGTHLSLAILGGTADEAGIETLLSAPYASLAVDLIAGPNNWRLVVATPRERGIVCGALSTADGSLDGPELLLWAAGYAASTAGRGPDRVGLATAGSLAHLSWDVAVEKMTRLGAAAALYDRPAAERAQAMDPRAVSSRSAALGRVDPPPPRDPDRGSGPT